ncbi:MAG: TIGR04282 family arsenosugar biosynthesis glycosyltransferase [Nitrosomonadaceae bacterium]|jgi:rSAM/selenodomain-associated transferase 1|nr:TIGR04282 family arsenosugar biosynthesis glycosyltransferase [Nitrosomonadaceae bacterium]
MKPVRIIIFTKAAQAGFTKTRLIPALGKQGAANLAKKMLIHTLNQSLEAGVGPVEMCVTPPPTDSIWQEFAVLGDLEYSDQGTGDLGERLSRVTQRVIDRGESLLIIGTDCTQLTATHLQRAKESLHNFDSILIPATDGGYVLFGLNFFHASLFESIKWSTDTVYAETTERLETLGRTIKIFPSMNDIDEPKDLKFLPSTWKEADY